MSEGKISLLIDTDPGVDDAMAILAALNCSQVEVIGVTTLFGNVTTDTATKNALRLVEMAGMSEVLVGRDVHVTCDGMVSSKHCTLPRTTVYNSS